MKTPRERKLEKALKQIAATIISAQSRFLTFPTNSWGFLEELLAIPMEALKPEPKARPRPRGKSGGSGLKAAYKKYHPRA